MGDDDFYSGGSALSRAVKESLTLEKVVGVAHPHLYGAISHTSKTWSNATIRYTRSTSHHDFK